MKKTFLIPVPCAWLLATLLAAPVAAQTTSAKPSTHRELAVTLDDLPAPSDSVPSEDAARLKEMTGKLLASLRANHIPAIGFVNEANLYKRGEIDARVDILRMWLDAGMELGNHTFSHRDLQTASLAAYEDDVIRGETVTSMLLGEKGRRPMYFRHPFLHVGRTSPFAGRSRGFSLDEGTGSHRSP